MPTRRRENGTAAPRPRSIVLIPRVSDQRLFLSPEQDQDCADDGEHQRDRLIEKVGLDQALPDPRPRPALDLRLQRRQRVLVDVRPSRAHAADIDGLVRYRLGAVMDQEDKPQGERQQTDEPKNKADHDVLRRESMHRPSIAYPARPLRSIGSDNPPCGTRAAWGRARRGRPMPWACLERWAFDPLPSAVRPSA